MVGTTWGKKETKCMFKIQVALKFNRETNKSGYIITTPKSRKI